MLSIFAEGLLWFAQRSRRLDFSVVIYRCESLTIKKSEHQRTDAFEHCVEDSWESPRLQGDPTSPS